MSRLPSLHISAPVVSSRASNLIPTLWAFLLCSLQAFIKDWDFVCVCVCLSGHMCLTNGLPASLYSPMCHCVRDRRGGSVCVCVFVGLRTQSSDVTVCVFPSLATESLIKPREMIWFQIPLVWFVCSLMSECFKQREKAVASLKCGAQSVSLDSPLPLLVSWNASSVLSGTVQLPWMTS